MNTKMTDVVMVLDESGSMDEMGTEPVQAVNEFIKLQKNSEGLFTLYTFNSSFSRPFFNTSWENVGEFTNYHPDGPTALYDCIGKAIDDKMATECKNKVMLVIITDGRDNTSTEYTSVTIRQKIKEQEEKYGWQVVYLAANEAAFEESRRLNLERQTSSFCPRTKGSFMELLRTVSTAIPRSDSSSSVSPNCSANKEEFC